MAKLDLVKHDKTFVIKWINVENADWGNPDEIKGGRIVDLEADNEHDSFAILIRK